MHRRKETLPIPKAFYEVGINFFDTANGYSNRVSEETLGQATKKYNFRRENIVIATKVCRPVRHIENGKFEDALSMSRDDRDRDKYINAYELSRKHIFDLVNASLKMVESGLYRFATVGYNVPFLPLVLSFILSYRWIH